jgi:hypothetical protein
MTSAISTVGLDAEFPIPGRDNDSQGFRTRFGVTKTGLEVAAEEISLLQANKADLIEQSVFTNSTPSYSTETGAIVVLGGMGIGGDVYIGGGLNVNGGTAITSSTAVSSTTTDVIMTGTYGTPIFALGSTLTGIKKWRGPNTFSPATTYDYAGSSSTNVFISTTATSADIVALHSRITSYGVALKLDMKVSNGGNKYISFIKTDGSNNETELGNINLNTNGTTLQFNNSLTFTAGLAVSAGGVIVTAGGATVTAGGLTVSAGGAVITGGLRLPSPGTVPATTSTTGIIGQVTFDTDHIYVCIGTNQWKRAALASW